MHSYFPSRAARRSALQQTPGRGPDSMTLTGRPARLAGRHVLLAAVALLAFIAPFQGMRGLWEPDEGRYSSVALRMLDRGDFLIPYIDAEHPHLTKPPLTYWALAASFATFGKNEWAARAPNALAFTATGLLVAWLASMFGMRRPLLATVVWSTMLLPVLAANAVTTDTLLTMFETLAVAGYVWRLTDPRGARAGIWLLWTALGAGFLTKGPPALLALLPVIVVASSRGWQEMRAVFSPLPLTMFAGIGLGWFSYLVGQHPALGHYFLLDEVIERVGTGVHHRNPGWAGLASVYLPTLLLGPLPWLPAVAWFRLRAAPGQGGAGMNAAHTWRWPDATLLLVAWLVPPFAVFALSQSRLPLYLLPLFVPMALFLAAQLPELRSRRSRTIAHLLLAIWVGGLLALQAGAASIETRRDARRLAAELQASVDVSRIDEIVFVDRAAVHGLRMYLSVEVEEASILPAQPVNGFPGRHGVCDEVRERRSPLLIVRRAAVSQVLTVTRECGVSLVDLGPLWGAELLGPAGVRRR